MRVQVGQVGDAHDVGGLVEHGDQRRIDATTGPFGGGHGGAHDGVGGCGDDPTGRTVAVLAQQVHGVGAVDERVGKELRGSRVRGDPRLDGGVEQARGHLPGGLVDALASFDRAADRAVPLLGQRGEPAAVQHVDGLPVDGVGQPGEHIGDGSVLAGGGVEQRGEGVVRGGGPEIAPGGGVGDGRGEQVAG
ncbi:MAG: hypothetical protein L0Y54_10305 [Sporichthyaceae bacterium]|nr:hypothetical protein [Sporichthyaceae bacterium]